MGYHLAKENIILLLSERWYQGDNSQFQGYISLIKQLMQTY